MNPYGESKLGGELLLARAGSALRRVVIRPPWVYGPGDRQTLPLFRMASRGFFPSVRGGRMQVSLVHVDDLVDAIVLAGGAARRGGRVYYVTDGRVHTVAELGDALLEACGGGRRIRIPGPLFLLAGLAG
jgi:nucleoside-diphosphate-sugar epimerase